MSRRLSGLVVAAALVLTACAGTSETIGPTTKPGGGGTAAPGPSLPALTITSPDFKNDEPIPQKFSAKGDNVNPALEWSGIPDDAQELVLIVDDPDAPGETPFVHWVVYGISADSTGVAENAVPPGAIVGPNSLGKSEYFGPDPPVGPAHHFNFRLFALREKANVATGTTAETLLENIQELVLAEGLLIGTYQST